jgi:pathogenesis-related protein 1
MTRLRFGCATTAAAFPLLMLVSIAQAADAVSPSEQQTLLGLHNSYRAQHCVPPLSWSTELAASAQQWASRCRIGHAPRGGFGENLAWGYKRTPNNVVDAWYKEVTDYDYRRPGFASSTGHFTQVIWRNTKQVGCGVATCLWGSVRFWVCRYTPQGNWAGQFPQNVPQKCRR